MSFPVIRKNGIQPEYFVLREMKANKAIPKCGADMPLEHSIVRYKAREQVASNYDRGRSAGLVSRNDVTTDLWRRILILRISLRQNGEDICSMGLKHQSVVCEECNNGRQQQGSDENC